MPHANPGLLAKFIGRAVPELKVSDKACRLICDKIDAAIEFGMAKNYIQKLNEIIQRTLKKASPEIQIQCLNGIKNYLRSIDFQVPRKYQAKQKWLLFTEISETDLLNPIYHLLDEMVLQNQEKYKTQKKPVLQRSNSSTFLTTIATRISYKILALIFLAEKLPRVKSQESIEEFVQAQQTIRILAVKVGGYGHLAGTQTVMQKLRADFGFTGTFEVVYPRMDEEAVNVIFENSHRTELVTLEDHVSRTRQQKTEPLTLGMSGSGDDNESPCKWISVKMGKHESTQCRNVAELLNVAVYASVTHHPYGRGYAFQSGDLIYLPKHDKRFVVTKPDTFFTAPQTSFTHAKKLIASDDYLKTKKPALDAFVQGMEDESFEVLPVYGKTIRDERDGYDFLANMFQIIAGVRHAQLQKQSECETSKPVVIAIYHPYETELSYIENIIDGDYSEILNKPASEAERIVQKALLDLGFPAVKNTFMDWVDHVEAVVKELNLDHPAVFQTASISNVGTTHFLETSQPQILLLSMGSFPKPIFDGLFTHISDSTLPAVREGYGTLSNVLLSGRPHFMCSRGDWDVGYGQMSSHLAPRLKKFYKHFCQGGKSWKTNPEFYKELGNLINEARLPESEFSHYFAALKNAASRRDNDRVAYMLARSMQFLRGDKSGSQVSEFPHETYQDRNDERSNRI